MLRSKYAMNYLAHVAQSDLLSPRTALGAVILGALFLVAAVGLAAFARRGARRLRVHLSDVTGLAFASALGQFFVYVVALILYAHLIPDLRSVGTALLAGASVVSVVFGLAAQSTLSNVVAGFSLVLYRPQGRRSRLIDYSEGLGHCSRTSDFAGIHDSAGLRREPHLST